MAHYENGMKPQNLFEKFHFATLSWEVPVAAAILYAIVVTIWGSFNKAKALRDQEPRVKSKKSHHKTQEQNRFSFFNCLVIAHNIFLTVFSAYSFVCIVKILFESYVGVNFFDAYCDRNLKQYYTGVNYLVWLFYLSKYYELIDTFILLIKGKPSSFLQTYHHSGSILSLWTMCVTRIPGMWIFTFLNSFIHTLMYYYFTLTCLGYRPTWKRHLTTMQISQFLIGNVFGIAYVIIPNCYNWNHNFRENVLQHKIFGGSYFASIVFTYLFNFFFVGGLILLFNDFARRTYGKKNQKQVVDTAVKTEKPKKKSIKAKESSGVAKKSRSKASPMQIATSIIIETEPEAVSAMTKATKSRARSTVRSKSKAPKESRASSKVSSKKRRSISPAKARSVSPTKTAVRSPTKIALRSPVKAVVASPTKDRSPAKNSPSKARALSPVRRSRRS